MVIHKVMSKGVFMTLGKALDRAASTYPDKECAVYPEIGLRWTYSEFRKEVMLTARKLLNCGIETQENVAVWASNLPEWLVLQFATAKIGAVLVTVNTAYQEKDLKYLLEQSESSTLFLMDKFKKYSYVDILENILPVVKRNGPQSESLPHLKRVVTIGESREFMGIPNLADLPTGDILDEDVELVEALLDSSDPINIQYTSGTTGFPKGAVLTHDNIVTNALAIGKNMKFSENDKIVLPNPLFHCFGCVIGTLLSMLYCGCVVFPNMYDPTKFVDEVLEAVHDEGCTTMYGTPSHFDRILKSPDVRNYDLSSLRTGVIAGAPCPLDLMELIESYVPDITIGYGSTELSPIITQTRIGDSTELRLNTVGKAIDLPGLYIKLIASDGTELVNTETGNVSGANTLEDVEKGNINRGVIWSKGPQVMSGYYNKPEATSEAIQDGWYNTGDIGTAILVGEQVYFKITGRAKEMIITGGENVYPTEIENVIREHPDVFDVAVYGIPDEGLGEVAVVSVIPKPEKELTAENVRNFCIKSGMRKNYVPRLNLIEIRGTFPMTASGKIQKFKLQKEATTKYGRNHLLERKTA